MDILVAKITSALVLWILSLCFGLMIPFVLWKSKADSRLISENEHLQLSESENLLSGDESSLHYNAMKSSKAKEIPIKKWTKVFYFWLCSYDVTSFISCFCGGLFLGICLLELLPEAREGVTKVLQDGNIHLTFPVTEFIVAIGLLLVMLIEHFVSEICIAKQEIKPVDQSILSEEQSLPTTLETPCYSGTSLNEAVEVSEAHQSLPNDYYQIDHTESIPSENVSRRIIDITEGSAQTTSGTRALLLVVMLSFHSIFEGLAIGLERNITHLIQLVIAVTIHKCILVFGVGLKIFKTFTPHRVILAVACMLIFCTASPIGSVVGILMTPFNSTAISAYSNFLPTNVSPAHAFRLRNLANVPGSIIANAILECLATGTFLYITFIEVIPSEFGCAENKQHFENDDHSFRSQTQEKKPIKPMLKLLIFVMGFALITALQFI